MLLTLLNWSKILITQSCKNLNTVYETKLNTLSVFDYNYFGICDNIIAINVEMYYCVHIATDVNLALFYSS